MDRFLALDAGGPEKSGRRGFERTVRMLGEIARDWPAVIEKIKRDHPRL